MRAKEADRDSCLAMCSWCNKVGFDFAGLKEVESASWYRAEALHCIMAYLEGFHLIEYGSNTLGGIVALVVLRHFLFSEVVALF